MKMKFFPENSKKTLTYAIVLVGSLSGIVYLNFFTNRPISNVTREQVAEVMRNSPAGAPDQRALVPSNTFSEAPGQMPAIDSTPSALLPYGSTIDTSILGQEKFKALRSSPQVQVRPEELGKTNPFSK